MTPRSATATSNEFELSSNFQPVMSTVVVPVFVTSNQSAAYAELLPAGWISEITTPGASAAPTRPAGSEPADASSAMAPAMAR